MSTVPDVGSDTGRWDLRRCLPSPLAVVGLVAGVLAIFSPVVLSGLEVTLSGLGDPRLVNYTLEHGYRWLLGYPLHADFWSPPIFYPHANVSAYTDVLIGVGPFYWCWRLLGWAPDTALLLWILTVWSLNYIAVFVLLRRFFQVGPLGATAGSLLFTFGAPRTLNFAHLQLAPNFYAIIVIMALFRVFGSETDPLWRRWWIAVGTLAIVLQAYTAFYPLYLLFLGLALTAIWGLVFADSRASAARRLRREWAMFLAAAVVGGVLIWPLAGHYMRAQDELSDQRFVVNNIPRPASWILMGPRNLTYGWLQSRTGPYADLRGPLHSNGIGFVTLGLSLLGLWWGRRRRAVQFVFLAVLGVFVLSTMFPGGFSFWRYVHEYLPGASALRATGRVGMVLLLLGAVGAALFFERLQSRRRYLVAGLLLLVCALEQRNRLSWIPVATSRERVAGVAARVDPSCQAFLLVTRGGRSYRFVHDDAAWVSLATDVPTVNGRYGHFPPNWQLRDVHIDDEDDEPRIRAALGRWAEGHSLAPEAVCLVEM